jgi:hypothetical protein
MAKYVLRGGRRPFPGLRTTMRKVLFRKDFIAGAPALRLQRIVDAPRFGKFVAHPSIPRQDASASPAARA